MSQVFTSLEIQLIRSSLATKTDEEIAELLEAPVTDVIDKINELTDGGAEQRSADVATFKMENDAEKKKKRAVTVRTAVEKEKKAREESAVERRRRERTESIRIEQQRQMEISQRATSRVFKSRKVDYSQMKSVMVKKGTWIYVSKDVSNKDAIDQYHRNIAAKEIRHLPTGNKIKI